MKDTSVELSLVEGVELEPAFQPTPVDRSRDDYDLKALVWQYLTPFLRLMIGRPISDNALHTLGTYVSQVLQRMSEEGHFAPDYLEFGLFTKETDPTSVVLGLSRCFRRYPMTKEEYEELVGVPPMQDDLDRVNCAEAGQIGHSGCGWCLEHQKPRFMCGCTALPIISG